MTTNTDHQTSGYQAPECGPWGIQLSQELGRTMRLNTGFSEFAWQNAKQEGCHYPCPGRNLPSWPPCGKFIYPTLQKNREKVLGANEFNPDLANDCPARPWQDHAKPQNELTCAMQRAHNFLTANEQIQASGNFNYSQNVNENADFSREIANSILRGQIPVGDSGHKEEKAFSSGSEMEQKKKSISTNQNNNSTTLTNFFPLLANTWTGIVYDLAHYDELPMGAGHEEDKNVHVEKLEYVFVRDDRWKYVLMSMAIIAFLIIIIVAIVLPFQ